MKNLLDNLHLYELVLLFLGAFLFMILCGVLIYYVIKKEDIKKLLWFFPIPIIMMGYSSIQEIQIENDKIALKKYTEEIIEHPDNTEAKEELIKITEKLEDRVSNLEDIKSIAEANLIIGNNQKVIDLTDKILKEEHDDINKTAQGAPGTGKHTTKTTSLERLRKVAELQENIETNPEALKDTANLKYEIDCVTWQNPKTKTYLNKKLDTKIKEHHN